MDFQILSPNLCMSLRNFWEILKLVTFSPIGCYSRPSCVFDSLMTSVAGTSCFQMVCPGWYQLYTCLSSVCYFCLMTPREIDNIDDVINLGVNLVMVPSFSCLPRHCQQDTLVPGRLPMSMPIVPHCPCLSRVPSDLAAEWDDTFGHLE